MPPLPFNSPQLLGALEIGAFIGIFMFGTIVVQGHIYYKSCMNDSKFLVSFITLILVLEFGHTIATAQSVWWATITIVDLEVKPGNGYATATCTLYSALVTGLVKAYYINRIRIFTSKNWLVICGWFITSLDFASSIFVSVEAFLDVRREPDDFALEREWGWLITTSLALAAVVDVFIAVVMVYHLKQKKGAARAGSMNRTVELMNGLLIWTIETGLLTSVVSVAALICFQTMAFNYIWFAVYLPLAKLYSNSLLASLNTRSARRRRYESHPAYQLQMQSVPSTSATSTSVRFANFDSLSSLSLSSARLGMPISRVSSASLIARRSTVASSNVSRKLVPPGISSLRRSTVASASGGFYEGGKKSPRKPTFYPHVQSGVPVRAIPELPNGHFHSVVSIGGKKKVTTKGLTARRISTSTSNFTYTPSSTPTSTFSPTPTPASTASSPSTSVGSMSSTSTGSLSPSSFSAPRLHSPTVRSIVEAR